MTDTTVLNEPVNDIPSNVIEPRGHDENPSASAHKEQEAPEVKEEQPKKPESRMEAIKRAAADLEKANAKPEDKDAPKADEKTEVRAEAKTEEKSQAQAEKPEGKTAQETAGPKQPESRRANDEAPARFLPKAKEQWLSAPRPVREEVQRVMREHDAEIAQYREAKHLSEDLAEFDRMAKGSGTTLKQAMSNYVGMENAFRSDPAQGFRALMGNLQMQPQQAISHILRAYGVTPQQLVQHMTQNPNDYTALAQPRPVQHQVPQQQEQRVDPSIQALQDRISQMEAERVADAVIRPFAEEFPEYYQYEEQIAKVLKTGIIEQIHGTGLSPRDKLEAALQMVAPRQSQPRIDTAPVHNQANLQASPDQEEKVNKSIKGAPSPGMDSSQRRGKMSRTQALDAAWAELGLR